ncbi:CRE-CUTL-13 protein [Aphelenchoides avenae]|nr:CRE-CUTL-13 protein [Aphelenchus avenae]
MIIVLFLALVGTHGSYGTTIDNNVVDVPEVVCAPDGLIFRVRTQHPFRGKLYVRGQFGIESCRAEFYNNANPGAQMTVRYGDCGMIRMRQLEPPGVNYALVIVTSFHPQFVTVVDRSFNVRCFFGQAQQVLKAGMEVGPIPTVQIQHEPPMRPCRYTVHVESINGPPAVEVNIGQKVFHVFECFTEGFGMLVKNCIVSDGGQTAVPVIDERGCPIMSEVVQGPMIYDNRLMSAYFEVDAYKLPDRNQVFYQCEISLCVLNTQECMGVTPPNCPRMPPAEYVPNAIINPNVDPTQLYGTYGTDVLNGIPYPGLPTPGYTNTAVEGLVGPR